MADDTTGRDRTVSDPLESRLGSYFQELAQEPLPNSLRSSAAAHAQQSISRGRARRTWLAAAVAVAAVVVVAVLAPRTTDEPPRDVVAGDAGPSGEVSSTVPAGGAADTVVPDGEAVDREEIGEAAGGDDLSEPSSGAPGVAAPAPVSPGATLPVSPTTTAAPRPTTTTTAPPPTDLLFLEDFTSTAVGSVPPGWGLDSGSWLVGSVSGTDHVLSNTTASGSEGRASTGSSAWRDYEVIADVGLGGGTVVGVGVRYQDAANYYFCKVDRSAGRLYLGAVVGGGVLLRGEAPFTPAASGKHRVTVGAVGAQLSCRVAGGPTLTATDTTFGTGRVAALGKGDVWVSRIEVRARS